MPPQTTTNVPEEQLPEKLKDDWLPDEPLKIEMKRETTEPPHRWTVIRHYE
jgi:hypothetical protein